MKLKLSLFVSFILLCSYSKAQSNFWTDIGTNQLSLAPQTDWISTAEEQRLLQLDFNALQNYLQAAPQENQSTTPLYLDFPMPDGSLHRFQVEASPVMVPELAAKFPEIKSYIANSITDPSINGRFDLSPNGLNAYFNFNEDPILISSLAYGQTTFHSAYYAKDFNPNMDSVNALACGYENQDNTGHTDLSTDLEFRNEQAPVDLRVYTVALACTGEYAQDHGGTVETVMASFNTAMNTVNAIFEPEVAVRLMLIANNEDLIFLNPATDPYSNADFGEGLLDQNANTIVNVVGIPFSLFDLGHVFTAGCTDVGGIAGGTTCSQAKARGVTCHGSTNVAAIARRIMAHEIAHQFSAGHSWSNCPGNQDQFASGSAYEPGSGSTIMSYSGACGTANNLSFGSDDYYHVISLEEFIRYSRDSDGDNCATIEPTGNNEPELTLNYGEGFYIPISTPFELRADAFDPDDHPITYCWEQFNLGPQVDLGDQMGNSPSFRSWEPKTSPVRVFPRIQTILANMTNVEEVLPTYDRNLTFRCTVRDNQMGGGGTVWEEVSFEATATAGPFLVESPNTGDEEWEVGAYTEVSWDVANTDNSLVKCRFVNIWLSTTGGTSFPILLAENVLNDGSHFITVPDNTTSAARVRIEAADNIFFDVSNANFKILPASTPNYTLNATPSSSIICLPQTLDVTLTSGAVLGFDSPISFEITEGLPEDATATFSATSINPEESATLTLDLPASLEPGYVPITLQVTAADADTTYHSLDLLVTSNDFSSLSLSEPVDGLTGVGLSSEFSWMPSTNADYYEFELATSPSFGATVVETTTNIIGTTYTPTILFEENTIYYWRVRPVNSCGPGAYLTPRGFQTINVNCAPTIADDLPIPISGTGTPTVQSQLFINQEGIITDINIPIFKGSYQPVNSIRLTLTSPSGTEVVLFDQNCGNTLNMNMGFDDEAPFEIICPPDDAIVYKPIEPLAAFIGENTFGAWIMKAQVIESGFGGGGSIENWELEFCADFTPNNPFLIVNDTLFVPPAEANTITPDILEVQDDDNTPAQLSYALISTPVNGILFRAGEALEQGATFTQSTVNAFNLTYLHDGSDTESDQFLFTVSDGTGGWLPTQQFNIKIDEDAIVDTDEWFSDLDVLIYPNPVQDELKIEFKIALTEEMTIRLFNIHGQEVARSQWPAASELVQINTSNLPAGAYALQIASANKMISKKVIIQK